MQQHACIILQIHILIQLATSRLLTQQLSLQVAYTASDAVFGVNKEKYPRFYRLVPVLEQTIDGCIALLKHLNWKRAAVIVYDDDYNVNVCFTYIAITGNGNHIQLAPN